MTLTDQEGTDELEKMITEYAQNIIDESVKQVVYEAIPAKEYEDLARLVKIIPDKFDDSHFVNFKVAVQRFLDMAKTKMQHSLDNQVHYYNNLRKMTDQRGESNRQSFHQYAQDVQVYANDVLDILEKKVKDLYQVLKTRLDSQKRKSVPLTELVANVVSFIVYIDHVQSTALKELYDAAVDLYGKDFVVELFFDESTRPASQSIIPRQMNYKYDYNVLKFGFHGNEEWWYDEIKRLLKYLMSEMESDKQKLSFLQSLYHPRDSVDLQKVTTEDKLMELLVQDNVVPFWSRHNVENDDRWPARTLNVIRIATDKIESEIKHEIKRLEKSKGVKETKGKKTSSKTPAADTKKKVVTEKKKRERKSSTEKKSSKKSKK